MSNSFKKFATRSAANAGQKLVLVGPDGRTSESWLVLRGLDSDAFQQASRDMRTALLAYLEANGGPSKCKGTEGYAACINEQEVSMNAALVASWSFDEDCNKANILALFTEAPYVLAQVTDFAGERVRFATQWATSCEPSQDTNLTLPSGSPQTQALPAANLLSKSPEPQASAPQPLTGPIAPAN